ncbi:putative N-acetylmannosaminyltransferase [Gammaproteobacteria bacterium MOLA455]|nr:putative N-acetylmannosaminyltransferase [Gammaproteobacteria bacterium MOLA455]
MSVPDQGCSSAAPATNRTCWSLLGLPFDQVDRDQALEIIEQAIACKTRCLLSTPNLNFIVQAQEDEAFLESVIYSDLVVADGMPVIWMAKLLGIPLRSRVAGSSLFERLQNTQRNKPISVFFFGGQGNVAQRAADNLNRTSVGMVACGALNPGVGSVESMSSNEIIEQINTAHPDFLVVALGAKKGQQWIMHNREKLNTSVISHLGAVVNFVGDTVQRAPLCWQKLGLEWLWRIVQEPLLWKRYFIDGLWFLRFIAIHVLPLAFYQKLLQGRADKNLFMEIVSDAEGGSVEMQLGGAATAVNGVVLKSGCRAILEQLDTIPRVSINCSDLDYIDSSALGTLMLLKANIVRRGGALGLFRISRRIRRLMRLHGVEGFLLE